MTAYDEMLNHELRTSTAVLFLQLVFILVMCRVIGRVLSYLKQPPVVGEILAGIVMGPTCLGQSAAFRSFMFPPAYAAALKGLSDLGIVFFMFILGLEFNAVEMMKSVKKTWMIGIASICLPFSLGAAISHFMYESTGMSETNPNTTIGAFILFTGAAMSFTAFPVLARILTANNALTAQIGLVAMGVTSMDDALAWTVLAIATSYQTGGSPENGAWGILIGIAWVLFLLIVVKRFLDFLRPKMTENMFIVIVFMGMCTSAWFTQVLGLHAFFGGFIFGVALPKHDRAWIHKFIEQLEVVIVNFFVPLFFANSGLNTDLTQLASSAVPVILVVVLACCGKMLPPFLLGRFLRGYSWRFSFQLASLMNARGLIELIALSIAKECGAFNQKMYSVFVVMALTTTFMSGPMFYFAYDPKKDPPAAQRASRIAAHEGVPLKAVAIDVEQAKPENEDNRPSSPTCVEIPPSEQLAAAAAHQFSGYIFSGTYGAEENPAPRPSILGKWDSPSTTANEERNESDSRPEGDNYGHIHLSLPTTQEANDERESTTN